MTDLKIQRRSLLQSISLLAAGGVTLLRTGNLQAAVEQATQSVNDWPDMEYRTLGNTGFKGSRLVFGCGAALSRGQANKLLEPAFEAGINVFDVGYRGYYRDAEKNLAPFMPKKINEILNKLISDIKNEVDESEKLRSEAKILLDKAQSKLDTAQKNSEEIIQQAKKDSDRLIIELNDKFHKSSEIKKNLAENKIIQMKETALKEIKDASIKIAVDSVKKIIATSVDKSKLDSLFDKNLEETKIALKKINS